VALLVVLLGGCAAGPQAPYRDAADTTTASDDALGFERLAQRRYTPDGWPETLRADVYLPETEDDARRPAALVVHGGGWQNRGPEDMAPIAEQLAARGFVAINIAHRFAPEYRFPAQLHDLQRAMAWLHGNAEAWRVDTRRVVGVGYSSGAHLVSLLALAGAEGPLAEPHGGEHARLAAVLAGGTPSDLFKFPDGRLVVDFLGGKRAEMPDRYHLASPARLVSPEAPPFFLFHGRWDRLVPVDHATDFHAELLSKGVESELFLQPWRGHFLSFLTRGAAMDAGLAFLDRQVRRR
jgi:acetyl esterase/lipase